MGLPTAVLVLLPVLPWVALLFPTQLLPLELMVAERSVPEAIGEVDDPEREAVVEEEEWSEEE